MKNPFLSTTKSAPIVVGHRGVPALHQENTLAGFARATRMGVPAVELDVRMTSDGYAVVCHDEELGRLTGSDVRVSTSTWDTLSKLRIRKVLPMGIDSHGAPVVIHYSQQERIPLLSEVLAEFGHKLYFNIELKLDSAPWWRTEVGVRTATLLAGLEDRVIVTSFDVRKLRVAKKANPKLLVGFCFDDSMLNILSPVLRRAHIMTALKRLLASHRTRHVLNAQLVGAEHTLISPQTVDALHRRGIAIGTYTLFPVGSTTGKAISPHASTQGEVERLAALGVDWIETDDPEQLMRALDAV